MNALRIAILVGFILLLGVPLLFRPSEPPPPDDALRLIVITPHNEQIRHEFARAFDRWHLDHFGQRVNVIYNVPGGTSEIRRMLIAQYTAALEAGREPGGDADLVFGGGTYEHSVLKRAIVVRAGEETRTTTITVPVDFTDEQLAQLYGPNVIGDSLLYDPDKHWFGTALSGFGIVFNRDALRKIGLSEPEQWEDLCRPELRGWVALVNPGQSGSITTAFETILQRRGWREGWRILRRAGANARYFSASSLKPPNDVSQGDAAMGVCIDFYGRYQSQAIISAGGADRVGYVDPVGATTIDADPISLLRGSPHPALARRFIEFCLSPQAQALWQFPARAASEEPNDLGPERYELRRLPILRTMYERHFDLMIDKVDPYALAAPVDNPNPHFRDFVAVLFAAGVMDVHDELQAAWSAIVSHPAYPDDESLVTTADVTDSSLQEMLRLFDALPTIDGPDSAQYLLDDLESLSIVRQGWLRGEWADQGLWHPEASPTDEMRRRFSRFFRRNYRRIVEWAEN